MSDNKEKNKQEFIKVQLVDANSSWEFKKGSFLKGTLVGTVNPLDKNVIAALKMKIIKKVIATK